jgi:phasin
MWVSTPRQKTGTRTKGGGRRWFRKPPFPQHKTRISMTDQASGPRKAAEKGLAQARENLQRGAAAASETASALEQGYANATQAAKDYNLKLMEIARANLNASFDLARDLALVRSPSEFVEVSSAHARKQFEALTQQAKELGDLAQRIGQETAGPLKAGMSRAADAAA